MKKVSAVIVTFNSELNILKQQYRSLIDQVDDIVYVDNGSENVKEIRKIFKEKSSAKVHFIENSRNMGLGYAQNQGLKHAINLGAEFLLILDHDSILKPTFVASLLAGYLSLCKKYRMGAVGPIYINELTNETYPITKYWGPFICRLKPINDPIEASCLIASGSLIHKSVLKEVGYMNEELFVDYIDIDWSYRARKLGYHLFAVPSAVMNHQIGEKRVSFMGRKISQHSPLRRYYLARNSIFMLRRPYISFGYKLRELTFNIARIVVFSFLSKEKLKYLKYSLKGVMDGFKGRFGEASILHKK